MAASKEMAKQARPRPKYVDDAEEIRKAIAASTSAAMQVAPPPGYTDDEEQLRHIMELSQQDPRTPLAPQDASDDEEFKKLLEASIQEAADHERRLKEARKGKQREREILDESRRTEQEDKKKRKEAQKLAEVEYQQQKKDAMWENRAEYQAKKLARNDFQAREKRRAKEIAQEERERLQAEREQQARAAGQDPSMMRNSGQRSGGRYGGRPGRHRPTMDDDENDPALQAQLRQAAAASLGDQGPGSDPTIDEIGWAPEDMPPPYQEIDRPENRKVLDDKRYTTTSRDISQPGEKMRITPEIKNQMVQFGCRQNIEYGEKNDDFGGFKVPKYKRFGDAAEKKALATLVKPPPSMPKAKAKAKDVLERPTNNYQIFGDRIRPQVYNGQQLETLNDAVRARTRAHQVEQRQALNRPFSRIPAPPRAHR